MKIDPGAATEFDPLVRWPGFIPSQEDRKGMLSVEDWAEIRRLRRAEALLIQVITQVLGLSKHTVKAALASDLPPKYQRPQHGSIVDEVEPRIRELLQAYPGCRPW